MEYAYATWYLTTLIAAIWSRNLRSSNQPTVEEIISSDPMFHPVFVSARAEAEIGGWK